MRKLILLVIVFIISSCSAGNDNENYNTIDFDGKIEIPSIDNQPNL